MGQHLSLKTVFIIANNLSFLYIDHVLFGILKLGKHFNETPKKPYFREAIFKLVITTNIIKNQNCCYSTKDCKVSEDSNYLESLLSECFLLSELLAKKYNFMFRLRSAYFFLWD